MRLYFLQIPDICVTLLNLKKIKLRPKIFKVREVKRINYFVENESSWLSSGLYYKTFRIVIYDRNDSTIVEPVL